MDFEGKLGEEAAKAERALVEEVEEEVKQVGRVIDTRLWKVREGRAGQGSICLSVCLSVCIMYSLDACMPPRGTDPFLCVHHHQHINTTELQPEQARVARAEIAVATPGGPPAGGEIGLVRGVVARGWGRKEDWARGGLE